MWRIHHLDLTAVTLNFSSAGDDPFCTSTLTADGTVILNATDLAVMEDDGCVQVIICPSCGTVRCEPGGWIMPRRFGEAVVWLPAFERLADDDQEFRPPDFVRSRGVPYFEGATARCLGELLPLFRLEGLAPVTPRDLALLTQWRAPSRVLGAPGGPVHLAREGLIAASHGDLDAIAASLESLLREALHDTSPVHAAPATPGPELFLSDGQSTVPWCPLVVDEGGALQLSLDGVTAAVGHFTKGQ